MLPWAGVSMPGQRAIFLNTETYSQKKTSRIRNILSGQPQVSSCLIHYLGIPFLAADAIFRLNGIEISKSIDLMRNSGPNWCQSRVDTTDCYLFKYSLTGVH